MNFEISKIVSILEENLTKSADHDLKRLLHGRGGSYPQCRFLNVDLFYPALFITLYEERETSWKEELVHCLLSLNVVKSIVFQTRTSPPWQNEFYGDDLPDKHIVSERGLKYLVSLTRGENPGIFPDMADGREHIRLISSGRNVLNLFSYTCAFSVAAIAGGAQSVLNMDMNRNSLSRGRENHRLNGHAPEGISYLSHNILKSFGKISRSGPFDLVIIDPPPSQGTSFQLERDYGKILRKCREFLSPEGEVFSCLNSHNHDFGWLKALIEENLGIYEIIRELDAGPDFPEENRDRGLKMIHLRPR